MEDWRCGFVRIGPDTIYIREKMIGAGERISGAAGRISGAGEKITGAGKKRKGTGKKRKGTGGQIHPKIRLLSIYHKKCLSPTGKKVINF